MKITVGLTILLLAATSLGADERLHVQVSPRSASAPADVFIQTLLQPSDQNREMTIVAESDDFYRSSEMSLEGERAPRLNIVRFARLPAGEYLVEVRVLGSDGRQLARVSQSVSIM